MKRITLLIFLLCLYRGVAGQKDYSNFLLTHNIVSNEKYDVYEIPLKMTQVDAQTKIDYSRPEGVLQSFFSANNKDWALSDYLVKPERMVRDQEHFDAVRKRDVTKDYIQLESIYNFEYNDRQFAFLKYVIQLDKLPFPLLGILSIEKVNNRWYISHLINQNQVSTPLLNFDNAVLISLFSNRHNSNIKINLEKLMQLKTGVFSFAKADRIFGNLVSQSNMSMLKMLKDKRIIDETFKAPIAIENSKYVSYKFEVAHPFLIDSTRYLEYSKTDSIVLSNTENMKLWEDKPESLLANETSVVKLDTKFSFYWKNKEYNVITYFSPIKNTIVIVKENGSFKRETISFQDFKSLFQNLKKGLLLKLVQLDIENADLARIKKVCSASDGVLNLSLLIDYLENNPIDKKYVFTPMTVIQTK